MSFPQPLANHEPRTTNHGPRTTDHEPRTTNHPPPSASVLILALWTLFFLSLLALAVGAHVSAATNLAGTLKRDRLARHLAMAGAQRAVAAILVSTNTVGLSVDTWNNDPTAFSGTVSTEDRALGSYIVTYSATGADGAWATNVGVVCEEARVNLNRMENRENKQLLQVLIRREGGRSEDEAKAIVTALADWCDEDDEAGDALLTGESESGYYQGLETPYSSHNGPLGSIHEFLLVRGVDTDLLAALEPYLTIYGEEDRININTAEPAVLAGVAESRGVDPREIDAVVSEIVEARPQAALEDFEALQSGTAANMKLLLTVSSSTFRGTAEGIVRGRQTPGRQITFVYGRDDSEFYFWHER